jgi:predicted O-methyltransferase YrrM
MNDLTQKEFDRKYENTKDRFNEFGSRVTFLRMLSSEAVKQFEDNSLDFVYIDGNHDYKYVEEDIRIWYPKVKKGGYLCGDDVYSHDEKEHDADKNVVRVWSRDQYGTPTCWGKYGTYMACKTNEELFGITFHFEENQFAVQK